jgi:hypothetical protein
VKEFSRSLDILSWRYKTPTTTFRAISLLMLNLRQEMVIESRGAFQKFSLPELANMDGNPSSPERSLVLARLLLQPIYREEGALWESLRAQRDVVGHYFRQIGQEVVIDEAEGYAFLRQIETDGGDAVPRIGRRQSLGYTATLLLVCLREELARFEASPGDSTRLVRTRQELRELVSQFLRETNNQVRDVRTIDTATMVRESRRRLMPCEHSLYLLGC